MCSPHESEKPELGIRADIFGGESPPFFAIPFPLSQKDEESGSEGENRGCAVDMLGIALRGQSVVLTLRELFYQADADLRLARADLVPLCSGWKQFDPSRRRARRVLTSQMTSAILRRYHCARTALELQDVVDDLSRSIGVLTPFPAEDQAESEAPA